MNDNEKKKIGLLGCITLGIGCIIGSGIFGSLPEVINDIGPATVWALILATAVVILRIIPATLSSSVVPVSGHYFMHQAKIIHPIMGIVEVGNTILVTSMLALYGVLFAEYFPILFPGWPLGEVVTACIFVTIFSVLGLLGTKTSSNVETVMVALLAFALLMYSVLGMRNLDTTAVSAMDIIKPGIKLSSFSAAIGVLTSCVAGGSVCIEVADEVKNARKTVPRAIILAPSIVCILYIIMAVVTIYRGTGELESLADIAQQFMSPAVLTAFIVLGPMVGIVTSFIPFMMMTVANFDFMARMRVYPDFFSKKNKHDVAWPCVVFAWLITIVIIATGQTFGIIMVIFSFANVMEEAPLTLVPLIIRKKYPKTVAHVPQLFNRNFVYATAVISFVISVYLGIQLFISMDTVSWVGVVATYAALFIYVAIRAWYLKKTENYDLMKELGKPYEPWEEFENSL